MQNTPALPVAGTHQGLGLPDHALIGQAEHLPVCASTPAAFAALAELSDLGRVECK